MGCGLHGGSRCAPVTSTHLSKRHTEKERNNNSFPNLLHSLIETAGAPSHSLEVAHIDFRLGHLSMTKTTSVYGEPFASLGDI